MHSSHQFVGQLSRFYKASVLPTEAISYYGRSSKNYSRLSYDIRYFFIHIKEHCEILHDETHMVFMVGPAGAGAGWSVGTIGNTTAFGHAT
jgi:3-deoxy-D-manno-octulosonic acid (KDO) 8-phosphate synthase